MRDGDDDATPPAAVPKDGEGVGSAPPRTERRSLADDDATVSTAAAAPPPSDGGVPVRRAEASTPLTHDEGDGDEDEHDDEDRDDARGDPGEEEYEHGLEPGDHVLRWTHVAYLYPIQVHGIVLSAGPGIVTLVDFGRSGSAPRGTYGPPSDDDGDSGSTQQGRRSKGDGDGTGIVVDEGTGNDGRGGGENSETEEEKYEEEATAAEKEASGGGKERQAPRRLVVMTLTEEGEIRQWRKVEYGGDLSSGGRLKRFLVSMLSGGSGGKKERDGASDPPSFDGGKDSTGDGDADDAGAVAEMEMEMMSEEELLRKIDEGCLQDLSAASRAAAAGGEEAAAPSSGEEATAGDGKKSPTTATLPQADPAKIVLARVRYLLEHEQRRRNDGGEGGDATPDDDPRSSVLPPYHIFFANSECTAVWCKTGTFSTLQASVFLHSTAIGNAKSAATLALFVSSQTVPVTVTVPAAGIMGWFGATTTATSLVPLLSTQPWLLPALAGYGVAAVGGPYAVLAAARGRWRAATLRLNDGFWAWADGEVYVEAIRGWSRVGVGGGRLSSSGAGPSGGGADAAAVVVR